MLTSTMRTIRQTSLRRALLHVLSLVPAGYLLTDDLLRADASRIVCPRPTTSELDSEIRDADTARLMTGVQSETGPAWKLSDSGRAWLAENP